MNPNWLNPQTEKKESVLAKVREEKNVEIDENVGIEECDTLITITTLNMLDDNGFIKTNVDLITEEGQVIAKELIDKDYPLDVMSVMMTLMQLFGESLSENDAMMMTDMILIAHDNGIEELRKLAEDFEAQEDEGMEGEGEASTDTSDEEEK